MKIHLSLLLQLFCLILFSQKGSFVATVNTDEIWVGQPFKLSFTLMNESIRNIQFPQLKSSDYYVQQGPLMESNFSSVNGVSNYSEGYSFIILPKKEGKILIPSATVIGDKGKKYQSKPLEIVVKSAGNQTVGGKDKIVRGKYFVKIEPQFTKVKVGQALRLDFVIYTQVDLVSIEISEEPTKFKDLYLIPLKYIDYSPKVKSVNGRQYAYKILHSAVVFPSQAGKLTIDPSTIYIEEGPFNGMNPFNNPKGYRLQTDPVQIDVLSLEEEAPTDFAGAVGSFNVSYKLNQVEADLEDMFQLQIRVKGLGDVTRILSPVLSVESADKDALNWVDPKVRYELIESAAGIGGEKIFDYQIIPQMAGKHKLKASFVYFDVAKNKFSRKDTLLALEVLSGKQKLKSVQKQNFAKWAEVDSNPGWQNISTSFYGGSLFWIVYLLPFLILVIFWFLRMGIIKWLDRREAYLEKTKHKRETVTKLKELQKLLERDEEQAFYHLLHETIFHYLSIIMAVNKEELSKSRVVEWMEEKGCSELQLRQMSRVLQISEVSVFAQQDHKTLMKRIYDDAVELFEVFFQMDQI